MIKVGVIGLGNIAQKAYLPVYSQLQDQIEWYLVSRDEDKLNQLKQKFGFRFSAKTPESLIESGVQAVFIHTPTATHYAFIKKFLQAGIHVFVDKPVSEDINEVEELYALAESKAVLLTCGFNRRFAPFHQTMKQLKNQHLIAALKTRVQEPQDVQFAVFDLLIHLVDLVQFLMGTQGVEFMDGQLVQRNQQLVLAQISLQCGALLGTARIDMQAGTNQEAIKLVGDEGINTVENLTRWVTKHGETKTIQTTPDWQSTLVSRGFEPMIKAFLTAVENHGENPVNPQSAILSHQLCARLISAGKVIEY